MDKEQNDEIDLQELLIKSYLFFKQEVRLISLCIGTGILASIILYFALPKIFEAKMILSSDILTESYAERITESLDKLIREDNTATLSARLTISEEEAKLVKKIEIESVKKENKDVKDESSIFIVTVDVGGKDILPKLQNGIITYLQNNEFIKIRVAQRQTLNKSMLEKTGREISSLDSLKKRLFSGQPVYAKSSEMLLIDPTNIYSKILELTKLQIDYKNALELVESIQLVEGFTVFKKPASPKLSLLLIVGFFGGFLFSLGFVGFRWLQNSSKP